MAEETPAPADPTQKLRATIAAFPGQGFAIVDGGHFEDVPALLRRRRLFARSLFLDAADIEIQKAGPWLVKLDQAPDATEEVLALVGNTPAAVYWCCEAGESVLWRHLRTLNMARIPTWAANRQPRPADVAAAHASESVMFRHWDPRVLADMLPVLDPAQFARIMGPAQEIAFVSKDHGRCRRVVRQADWPPPPPGLLTIRPDQIDALSARRDAASEARMMAFLRDTAPDETKGMSDEALRTYVAHARASAQALRLTNECSQSIWSHLHLSTKGSIATTPEVTDYLTKGAGDPNEKVQTLLHQMLRLARTDREVV